MTIDLEPAATAISAFIAGIALLVAWQGSRRSELRREEVLEWVNRSIAALQTLLLVCRSELEGRDVAAPARLTELRFSSSILVEQGRMFFRNAQPDRFGREKQPAYRGYRPCILDHLVVAHQIASGWTAAERPARLRMALVAEDCLKAFVSLAQKEVGRDRTASVDTSRGGDGTHVSDLMAAVDAKRLKRIATTLSPPAGAG